MGRSGTPSQIQKDACTSPGAADRTSATCNRTRQRRAPEETQMLVHWDPINKKALLVVVPPNRRTPRAASSDLRPRSLVLHPRNLDRSNPGSECGFARLQCRCQGLASMSALFAPARARRSCSRRDCVPKPADRPQSSARWPPRQPSPPPTYSSSPRPIIEPSSAAGQGPRCSAPSP